MKKNMGIIDRTIRTLLAILVGYLIVTGTLTGWVAWVLGILAVVFVVVSFIGSCPLYDVLKISTKPKEATK